MVVSPPPRPNNQIIIRFCSVYYVVETTIVAITGFAICAVDNAATPPLPRL